MLFKWDIEKLINKTLKAHNLDINYIHDDHLTVPMKYNPLTNTIKFNYMQINGYKNKFKIKVPEEDFTLIIIYHEIGHYLDFKNNDYDFDIYKENKRVFIQERERNAWKYGRELVQNELLKTYDKINQLDNRL